MAIAPTEPGGRSWPGADGLMGGSRWAAHPPASPPRSRPAGGCPRAGVPSVVAPPASIAGSLQVGARSAETALHKLHELGFALGRLVWAQGIAPLPPVAKDDLAAIG